MFRMKTTLLLSLFLLAHFANGAIIYVGLTPANVTICGKTPTEPCSTIDEALHRASVGDIIELLPGRYTGGGNSGVEIFPSVTIQGQEGADATTIIDFDGEEGFSILDTEVSVTFKRLTMTNGKWAIYDSQASNITIDTCHITFCGTVDSGSAVEIQALGRLNVNNSNIDNCNSDRGGAIDIQGGNVNITNTRFFNNTATLEGGAISMQVGSLNIVGCVFEQNRATEGGAISVDAQETLIVVNFTSFTNNLAGTGGAIDFSTNSYGNFANCTFDHNLALVHGGALSFNVGSGGSVLNSTFTENGAGEQGGAIFVITETIFELGTTVIQDNWAYAIGGGMYVGVYATLHAWDTLFYNNTAILGGGLFTENRAKLYFTDCAFVFNHVNATDPGAGAGIYCSDGRIKLNETTFSNNTGPGDKNSLYCATIPSYTFCSVSGTNPELNAQCGDHSSTSSQMASHIPTLAIVGIVLLTLASLMVVAMVGTCIWWRIKNKKGSRKSIVREEDVGLLNEEFD